MLYLIQIPSYSFKKCLFKVGFTDDLSQRLYQYTDHNPLTTVLGTREGGRKEEAAFHLVLKNEGYKARYLSEWFVGDVKVPEIFHWSLNRIHKYLWNNRYKLLYMKPIMRDGLIWELWKDLYKKERVTDMDKIFFSNSYRQLPKHIVNSEISNLYSIKDLENRVNNYSKFLKKWSDNKEIISELENRKSPLLKEIRISYSLMI